MEGSIQNEVTNYVNIARMIYKDCWMDELQKHGTEPHKNTSKWGLHRSVNVAHVAVSQTNFNKIFYHKDL